MPERDDPGVVLASDEMQGFGAGVFAAVAVLAGFWVLDALDELRPGLGSGAAWAVVAVAGPFCLLMVWCAVRCRVQRVTVRSDGLHVRGILTSRSIPWSGISGFATEPVVTPDSPWWTPVVLFRSSDRVRPLGALYSRSLAAAEDLAEHLRRLAPAGVQLDDRMAGWHPPPPPATDPGQRYVTRSWAYGPGGRLVALTVWVTLALLALLVGCILVFSPDGSVTGGLATISVTCLLTTLVAHWYRPYLAVDRDGLRTRRRRGTAIPWTEVTALTVAETLNWSQRSRRCYLEVHTAWTSEPLWGTVRRRSGIAAVHARVAAFRPSPR